MRALSDCRLNERTRTLPKKRVNNVLVNAILSTLLNLLLLAGLPWLFYYGYHRLRHQRRFKEIARRAGLQLGKPRYIGYCFLFALVVVVALIVWPPSLESSVAEGSAFQSFDGLGLRPLAIGMALLYGVFKTGFAEEFLFRGLIAGSLARRWTIEWANLTQALIFLCARLVAAACHARDVAHSALGFCRLAFCRLGSN